MKKILVVVDYQNDFVSGSLGFPGAVALEDRIAEKIEQYRGQGGEVAFTYDTHEKNYMETQEGQNLPVPHCLRGTPGWELYGKINALRTETDLCFEKNTFGSLTLAEYLKKGGYGLVELCGVVSNICVISNAVLAKAALPEAKIVVDASCTAGGDSSMNQKALDVMSGLQIQILNG